MTRNSANGRPSTMSTNGSGGKTENKTSTTGGIMNKKKQKKFGVFKTSLPRNLKENSRAELLSPSTDEVPSPKDVSSGVLTIPTSASSPSPTAFLPEAFLTDTTTTTSSSAAGKNLACCNGTTHSQVKLVRPQR